MKFRKKPVVIDAWKWGGIWNAEMKALALASGGKLKQAKYGNKTEWVVIETLEGDMKLMPEDYLIRGIKGEYYPCKPDIFEATYERV